jgi:hypothetical protein
LRAKPVSRDIGQAEIRITIREATAHGLRVSEFTCLPAHAAVLIGAG